MKNTAWCADIFHTKHTITQIHSYILQTISTMVLHPHPTLPSEVGGGGVLKENGSNEVNKTHERYCTDRCRHRIQQSLFQTA